jgi:DNA invertase Pin-like site-specific DNA recombinase
MKKGNKTQERRKVIGYGRVSTDRQATTGYSLEEQRERIEGYCAWQKWELVAYYEDAGKSAKTADREEFQEALLRLNLGDAEALVVIDLSRFARNARDTLNIIEDGREVGWSVMFIDMGGDSFDSNSATGKLVLTVLAAVAQNHSDVTSEKTKIGIQQARAAGKHIGRPEVITEVVGQRILRMHRKGLRVSEIALQLQLESILTATGKTEWHPETLRRFLRRSLGDAYVPLWVKPQNALERVNKS